MTSQDKRVIVGAEKVNCLYSHYNGARACITLWRWLIELYKDLNRITCSVSLKSLLLRSMVDDVVGY